jgi:hypothetical protein
MSLYLGVIDNRRKYASRSVIGCPLQKARLGSCVTSAVGSNGGAQLRSKNGVRVDFLAIFYFSLELVPPEYRR